MGKKSVQSIQDIEGGRVKLFKKLLISLKLGTYEQKCSKTCHCIIPFNKWTATNLNL